jgi:hypothetical protein
VRIGKKSEWERNVQVRKNHEARLPYYSFGPWGDDGWWGRLSGASAVVDEALDETTFSAARSSQNNDVDYCALHRSYKSKERSGVEKQKGRQQCFCIAARRGREIIKNPKSNIMLLELNILIFSFIFAATCSRSAAASAALFLPSKAQAAKQIAFLENNVWWVLERRLQESGGQPPSATAGRSACKLRRNCEVPF